MKNQSLQMQILALMGGTGVIFGAFGAHYLRSKLSTELMNSYQTGIQYYFVHLLASLILVSTAKIRPFSAKWVILCWLLGLLFFSGSLFAMAFLNTLGLKHEWLGPITPLGGLFFIAGWFLLAFAAKPSKKIGE